MMRIKSSGTQGNGNTSIYGDGGLLSLVGRTHAYMEFYRQGSDTPNNASVATPGGSGRGAYIGYPSGASSDFYVTNGVTNASLGLLNNGKVYITSRANSLYGVEIGNAGSGTVTNAYGVCMYGTFTNVQLQSSHGGIIARFDAKAGAISYTSVYVTTQGLLIWGCPTGTGSQPPYSGSAARPSISFNGNGDSGFYSDAANTLGVSTGGVSRMVINNSGVSFISSSPINNWSVTSLTEGRWVSNLVGTTLSSATDLPSVNYDRIIYGNTGGGGASQILLYVETTSNVFILLNRSSPSGYSGTSCIIPAGKKFRIYLDFISGSSSITFVIYKFGIN